MTDDATYGAAPVHAAAAPPPKLDQAARPVAHWTHTLALVAVLSLTTIYGRNRAAEVMTSTPHATRYLTSIVLEWLLLGSVIAGTYRRREFFIAAFRDRAQTWAQSLGLGAMVYVIGLTAIAAVGAALYATPLFNQRNEAYVLAMLPHTSLEFCLWFCVSLTAGICEELIFRGYLLQQLTAWTRSSVAAILLAALLFGGVHLYEGLGAVLPLAALAVVYGFAVRQFGGDLRAVIVAHTLQDFLVGFLALAKPWLERHAGQS